LLAWTGTSALLVQAGVATKYSEAKALPIATRKAKTAKTFFVLIIILLK
jgi:hypothetical protein